MDPLEAIPYPLISKLETLHLYYILLILTYQRVYTDPNPQPLLLLHLHLEKVVYVKPLKLSTFNMWSITYLSWIWPAWVCHSSIEILRYVNPIHYFISLGVLIDLKTIGNSICYYQRHWFQVHWFKHVSIIKVKHWLAAGANNVKTPSTPYSSSFLGWQSTVRVNLPYLVLSIYLTKSSNRTRYTSYTSYCSR